MTPLNRVQLRQHQPILSLRHKTVPVQLGTVTLGGGAPVVVQSMTNTDTSDILGTAQQCYALWKAGSELVRITVNDEAAAKAVPYIRDELVKLGWEDPLLIGDFHYIGHRLLTQFPACASSLVKYRINPGNVGFSGKQDRQFSMMIETALKYDKAVRIGVNWGSLDQALSNKLMDENAKRPVPASAASVMREALLLSALSSAERAQALGMAKNKIILSCKVSELTELVALYLELAKRSDYALHLGLTEAGMGSKGIIATACAFALLLQQGIGDTIRASLTPQPKGERVEEVRVCQEILQVLGLRSFAPMVTACPGCGRTTSQFFQELTQSVQQYIQQHMPLWQSKYPGVENMKLAVMGCIVNGPGESRHADIGISLPGTGESPSAVVFLDGEKYKTLRGDNVTQGFIDIIEEYVQKKYALPRFVQRDTELLVE